MPVINFSGLSTGIDSGAIIEQLTALERRPADLLENRVRNMESQLSTVGDLVSKLQALRDETKTVDTDSEVRSYAATTSNADRVTITSSNATAAGTYNVRVTAIAAGETSGSNTFATEGAGVVGTGSVDITVGANPLVTVSYGATDSLADIAARINDDVAGVNASVLFDGTNYRLLVAAEDTGAVNAITFADSGSSLGFADAGAELVTATDAQLSINGVVVTRASNTFSDVIPGVTMNLTGITPLTEADTVIKIDYDAEATRNKLQKFVDAYNTIASALDKELSYNGETKGADTLFGDTTLRGLRSSMSRIVATGYTHGTEQTSLGLLGIELGEDGSLSIDAAKFDKAVADDPAALEHLFAGDGGDGVAALLDDLVETYTRAGDGVLVAKQKGINSRIDTANNSIERIDVRAEKLRDRLTRQFTQLETLSARLQAQSQYLAALFT